MNPRTLSPLDTLIQTADLALRTLKPPHNRPAERPNPGEVHPIPTLSAQEQRHIAGLMRVNHAGEVCAQALYQGQSLTARLEHVQAHMHQAAQEETDHLAWCEARLHELKSQPSLFNPFWFLGSLCIGAVAGLIGDRWSLGFVAETEHQVTQHLNKHIDKLPPQDQRTKAILMQMKQDEMAHAAFAINAGAHELPDFIKKIMYITAKLLTTTSYYL